MQPPLLRPLFHDPFPPPMQTSGNPMDGRTDRLPNPRFIHHLKFLRYRKTLLPSFRPAPSFPLLSSLSPPLFRRSHSDLGLRDLINVESSRRRPRRIMVVPPKLEFLMDFAIRRQIFPIPRSRFGHQRRLITANGHLLCGAAASSSSHRTLFK